MSGYITEQMTGIRNTQRQKIRSWNFVKKETTFYSRPIVVVIYVYVLLILFYSYFIKFTIMCSFTWNHCILILSFSTIMYPWYCQMINNFECFPTVAHQLTWQWNRNPYNDNRKERVCCQLHLLVMLFSRNSRLDIRIWR